MQRQRRKLTVEDRVAIELRRKDGWGVRAIARELGRSPSVISAELGRDTDGCYAAGPAQAAAAARWDWSGRRAKLAPDSPLFAEVAKLLRLQWSPEQIAGKRLEDGTELSSGLRVRRSIRRSTPCHAVSCGASCSPACVRASRTAADGPRTANGGAGSATSSTNGQRRGRGAWCPDIGEAT